VQKRSDLGLVIGALALALVGLWAVTPASAVVQFCGIPRRKIRAGLADCKTFSELVNPQRKSGTDIVMELMAQVGTRLQAAVDTGKLTTSRRDEWRTAIQNAATSMVTIPGLHVAGIECGR
jgi:hypothetical protein